VVGDDGAELPIAREEAFLLRCCRTRLWPGSPVTSWRMIMHRWWMPASWLALVAALALSTSSPGAEDFVDLTLTFQGAVHGEIAPCG